MIDFLTQPSSGLLRKQIRNVKDSYSHPWDVLAEVVQNAVDAIRRFEVKDPLEKKKHRIVVVIDSNKKSIALRDSGTGFPFGQLRTLLAPHGTDKGDGLAEIGQKGIGLKFAIFSCDGFALEAKSQDGYVRGTINGASTWVERGIGDTPAFEVTEWKEEKAEPGKTFTQINLEGVEEIPGGEGGLFSLSTSRLVHLLRTKTAIGNTRPLYDEPALTISVRLVHVDRNGTKHELDIPHQYMPPTELLAEKDLQNLSKFIEKAAALDDRQKARELQDKTLVKSGKTDRAGRTIRYFACFVPSRSTWTQISSKIEPKIGGNEDEESERIVDGGIYIASRGMPTGISLVPPLTGATGYWPNTFILLEDDHLEFDLGRKSVPGRTQGMLKDIAKDIFNEFVKYSQYTAGSSKARAAPGAVYEQERRNTFKELDKLNDLGLEPFGILKYPDGQEAGVAAIFHELVGAGILIGYYALRQGYRSTYDFWGRYRIDPAKIGTKARSAISGKIDLDIVIEFKHDGEDIIRDVGSNRKFFEDIDILVCWDLDEKKFAKENIAVRVLGEDEIFYYGTNYKLEWPGAYNLGGRGSKHVIALRKLVEQIVARKNN